MNRTLKFIREKIKNETMTNRAEILDLLRTEGRKIMLPKGVGEAQFTFFNGIFNRILLLFIYLLFTLL